MFRNFFNAPAYFSTLNSLVTSITEPDNKKLIKEIESAITTTDVKIIDPKTGFVKPGLSQTAYEQTVGDLSISSTNSDGNCFFEAIANAINQYNYTNQQIGKNDAVDKIRYRAKDGSIYGESNNIFTIEILRQIVYDFLSSTNKSNAHYLDQKYTQAVNQVE